MQKISDILPGVVISSFRASRQKPERSHLYDHADRLCESVIPGQRRLAAALSSVFGSRWIFEQEAVIDRFIVDFYCADLALAYPEAAARTIQRKVFWRYSEVL